MSVICPICMDDLIGMTNHVTTECGHHFHASCLMQNISHNGFACPYCRNVMIEEPENSERDTDSIFSDDTSNERNENSLLNNKNQLKTLNQVKFFNVKNGRPPVLLE